MQRIAFLSCLLAGVLFMNVPAGFAEETAGEQAATEAAVASETTADAAGTESAPAAPETESTVSTEPAPQTEGENPVVIIKTGKGDIKVKLFADKAPITVANFLSYVDNGHYEGTIFHRVIGNFMIQGGGFTPDMQQKPTMAPIKNEAQNGLSNKRGTIAMARLPTIDSATSQFFINVVDNPGLDHLAPPTKGFGYCVFGEVVEGMEVVDQIRNVPTTYVGPFSDVPAEPVEIIQVVRVGTGN